MSGNTSRRYPPELEARAVRMFEEIRQDHATDWEAMGQVAQLREVSRAETVRKWVRQGQVDDGTSDFAAIRPSPLPESGAAFAAAET